MPCEISQLPAEMKLAVPAQLDRQSLIDMCEVSDDWLTLHLPLLLSKSRADAGNKSLRGFTRFREEETLPVAVQEYAAVMITNIIIVTKAGAT
ncbi:hypothetical protein CABS01_09575 [Colletotrichum abscissum]|uniref:Uncharacterized protein n=1 Tax=Colletotrichum abscissum TaxID=1671311 RepID=A0A9P9XPW3_9PEZI|nr:uncharacterized protein CABS01_09575 [Colletotrichum abscissum]KAI3558187.1 hypothetical protein CABS02_01334 [Colletotrichum abscissum]KAK1501844.1 hypothetical protein CABS01_09575 [Colletotrichum abscissum]